MKKLLYLALGMAMLCSCESTNDFHGRWTINKGDFVTVVEYSNNGIAYVQTSIASSDFYDCYMEHYTYTQTGDGEYTIQINRYVDEGDRIDISIHRTDYLSVEGTKMTLKNDLGCVTYKRKI